MSATLPSACKAVVFDAYGTLFDVHSAVMRYGSALGEQAPAFSALWRQKQLEYSWVLSLAGRYADFWTLTERALDYAFASHPGVDRALRANLLAAYRELDAYPEVKGTLARLRGRGLSTAILSNGEPGMLAAAVAAAGLGDLLDASISVADAGVFKTDGRTYALVPARLGVAAKDVVFVSSNRWDIAGATAFGFPCFWVNRGGLPDEYPDLAPFAVIRDLGDIG